MTAPDAVPDPVMARIAEGQERATAGDPAGAAAVFAEVWEQIGGDAGDPLHVVSLAHFMADVQDDPVEELRWDQRALAAVDGLTDERAQRYHATLAVRGFLPSLHLNLAADHQRLGDRAAALGHLDRAEAAVSALHDDGYGAMIRGGVARLRAELGPG
ncbi:hypothetical protein [Pseudonocardia sp. GCM10023141]|uniref:hypothetical protein n=1 Tax=Pseudonocardia sp. GCM10023141 TaxID=3252653 RepID=UPI003624152B